MLFQKCHTNPLRTICDLVWLSAVLLQWWISLQVCVKKMPCLMPSLRGHKVLFQHREIKICILFRAGPCDKHSVLWPNTHTLGKENTHQFRLISSWNKSVYSLQSQPPLLLLSLYVCVGKVSTATREKIITKFELLHKGRV